MDLVEHNNSLEESCDKDLNFISNRLPNKNILIKGKNFEYAIGRLISHGRYGAVYEVNDETTWNLECSYHNYWGILNCLLGLSKQ